MSYLPNAATLLNQLHLQQSILFDYVINSKVEVQLIYKSH